MCRGGPVTQSAAGLSYQWDASVGYVSAWGSGNSRMVELPCLGQRLLRSLDDSDGLR